MAEETQQTRASTIAVPALAMFIFLSFISPSIAVAKRGIGQAAPALCDDLSNPNGSSTAAWFFDWGNTKGSFHNSGCGTDPALHPYAEYVPQYATYWSLNAQIDDLSMNIHYVYSI
jgi:hypothetical protein